MSLALVACLLSAVPPSGSLSPPEAGQTQPPGHLEFVTSDRATFRIDGRAVARLPKGTALWVTESRLGWRRTTLGDKDGWVDGRLTAAAPDALARFSEAIREKDSASARVARAVVHLYLKEPAEAVPDCDAAIALDPADPAAYVARASARHALGDLDAAEADLNRALRIKPDYSRARLERARVRLERGAADDAIADLDAAIEADPAYAGLYLFRGDAWRMRGESELARRDFAEAVRRRPDEPESLGRLAWLLATSPDSRVRDGAEAVGLAAKAVELAPGTARFPAALAAAHAEAGDYAEAERWIARAVEAEPGDDDRLWRAMARSFAAGRPWRDDLRRPPVEAERPGRG